MLIAGDSFPSIMQERERKRANVSTISGKRRVRSLLGLRLRKAAFEIGSGFLAPPRPPHRGSTRKC